jgi:hypothetical protein
LTQTDQADLSCGRKENNGWMNGCMDGWIKGWINEWING